LRSNLFDEEEIITDDNGVAAFGYHCCLGVLCDVAGAERELVRWRCHSFGSSVDEELEK